MSCTSSTLYCLAPIVKILQDHFGVAEGFITSIHAMTPSLKPLDGLCLRGKVLKPIFFSFDYLCLNLLKISGM